MEISEHIVAILFYEAEPISIKRLSEYLHCSENVIKDSLVRVDTNLQNTGIQLIRNGNELTIGTIPEASALISHIAKEELSRDLSKASVETLSIILYKGPITRSEIDYIRGVNSTFILRNLLIRGLIEKSENPNDQRSFLYSPTFQLLEHIGISRIEDLPDYANTISSLQQFSSGNTSLKPEEEKYQQINLTQKSILSEELSDEEATILDELSAGENYDDEDLRERAGKNEQEKKDT